MKKLIAGIVAGLVLALPLSASATGIDKDKAQHIGACYAAELTLREVKPFNRWKPWQRALFVTGIIGGGKEWYDARHPSKHTADWGDIAADAVGAVGAEGTVWVLHKTW
jgi:hypothetical protein